MDSGVPGNRLLDGDPDSPWKGAHLLGGDFLPVEKHLDCLLLSK